MFVDAPDATLRTASAHGAGTPLGAAARLLDGALDLAVAPGFSSIGIRLRKRLWHQDIEPGVLAARDVAITGASSGIGEATCELLVRAGARVHMVVRDRARGEASRARVASAVGPAAAAGSL